MPSCSIKLCKNNGSKKNVGLFRFPKDKKRFADWAQYCKNPNIIYTKNLSVCEDHFNKEDIEEPETDNGRRRLKKSAVPRVNIKVSSRKVPSNNSIPQLMSYSDASCDVLAIISSYPEQIIQLDIKENAKTVAVTKLKEPQTISESQTVSKPQIIRQQSESTIHDCLNGASNLPCEHYIELIEEKARNHKLQRVNENLMDTNDYLQHKIEILENTLIQNGLKIDDIFVKFEVVEEDIPP